MPEAAAIVLVFLVAIVVYVILWAQSRNPALYNPQKESARLQQHLVWLEQRLVMARRENWGDDMIASIVADQTASQRELARVQALLATTSAPVGN